MLVPFGTHVLDRDGKSVGTVNSLVLHPDTQQGWRSSCSRVC